MRRSTFECDASAVQGNEGATVTFKPVTVGERHEYNARAEVTDASMLQNHIVSWAGIVDDDDNEMPSPADQPDIVNALYVVELAELTRLLWNGQDVPKAKN